ncbi:hypothetical protein TNCV_2511501 [Trichonephila clavipes]|nr:hypothetical protein TNCV_2511501 [Trichonephila clavipes]
MREAKSTDHRNLYRNNSKYRLINQLTARDGGGLDPDLMRRVSKIGCIEELSHSDRQSCSIGGGLEP